MSENKRVIVVFYQVGQNEAILWKNQSHSLTYYILTPELITYG